METLEWNDIINKVNLMNSYRSFYPNNKEDTFFSSANRTFSKFKKIAVTSCILSAQHELNLVINNSGSGRNNTLLKIGSRENQEGNLKFSRIEWKWKCSIPKSMRHDEGRPNKNVYSTKGLHK